MNDVYLSKSKYCQGKQCTKMLWLGKYKPDKAVDKLSEKILENGNLVGELAKNYFGDYVDIEFNKDLSKMIVKTDEVIKNVPNIITEASFDYHNNFCSVDILKNDVDGVEIYEVKSSSSKKDIYLDDISYQVFVLTNLGYNVKKACLMHINSKYVRQGELELDKLLVIEDVTDVAFEKQDEIKNKIEEIKVVLNEKKEPKRELSTNCFQPYSCAYWEYCSRKLPKNNVFTIRGMHLSTKFKLYKQGKISFKDIRNEKMNWKYKQQVQVELSNKKIVRKGKIRSFMKDLKYPLYFLDFETFSPVIPKFDGTTPYDRIPFQYSLHYIEEEGGEVRHAEFLADADVDPRRKLAEQLIKDIPKDVTVIAYNMSFEKGVIRRLAEQFSDLKEHLLNINYNMKDLMIPFFERFYYEKKFKGSYSIKVVLPTLFPDDEELDYHNLEGVHNGDEASGIFENLGRYTVEEQKQIRENLLKYCCLDTWAMVKIYQKLKELIA